MTWGPVRSVWAKELRDTVRDRRTLLVMIIMPVVLTPLLIVGSGYLVKMQLDAAKKATKKCLLVGIDLTPGLEPRLREIGNLDLTKLPDAKEVAARVRDGEAHAALVVLGYAPKRLWGTRQTKMQLYFKST